jgi:hypothetical protein
MELSGSDFDRLVTECPVPDYLTNVLSADHAGLRAQFFPEVKVR